MKNSKDQLRDSAVCGVVNNVGVSESPTCHNVRSDDPAPTAHSGSMEDLAERRGGIWAATPLLQQ